MDKQYIHDHQVIDRYLQGKLTEAERTAFEQYYFEHPEVLDEIELARSMHRGIRANAGYLSRLAAQSSWRERLAGWLRTPAWSLTATAAAVALAALLLVRPDAPLPSAAGAIAAELDLLRMRSAPPRDDPPARLDLPEAGLVLITADAADLMPGRLQVDIERADGARVASLTAVADDEGLAMVALPAAKLRQGAFVLRLTDAGGRVVEYSFNAVSPNGP